MSAGELLSEVPWLQGLDPHAQALMAALVVARALAECGDDRRAALVRAAVELPRPRGAPVSEWSPNRRAALIYDTVMVISRRTRDRTKAAAVFRDVAKQERWKGYTPRALAAQWRIYWQQESDAGLPQPFRDVVESLLAATTLGIAPRHGLDAVLVGGMVRRVVLPRRAN